MYVRQVGGQGILKGKDPSGDPVQLNSATDPSGDATYDAPAQSEPDMTNLDILGSSVSWPEPSRVTRRGGLPPRENEGRQHSDRRPGSPDTDSDIVWLTQWLVRRSHRAPRRLASCPNGGLNFMAYGESRTGSHQC